MLCKNPFVRHSTGFKRIHMITSEEAREFGTPFPCGQCLPCRINKSRVWTHRILLEQTQHPDNCFVTLTYNDEHLPANRSLQPDHLTKFFKRLRKRIGKFRYYAVGEYGEQSLRPHYHFALFGHGLDADPQIESAWSPQGCKLGYHFTGDLNKDSARYITGYITNKLHKDFDERLIGKEKEFMRCSKMNGGIGSKAISQIAKHLNNHDAYDKQTIKTLKYGKKEMPLGGYLSKKLNDMLDNKENLEHDFRDWQDRLFDSHFHNDKSFYFNVVNDNAPKRKSVEKKHKIYRKRNKL